jgi:DNA-binding NarL/FixJ family response regulator
MIRVIIADDHHLVREGIRALLEKGGGVEIIAEASDGQAALELVEKHKPDVLLIDVAMPRMTGLQTLQYIQEYKLPTRVVILSMYSDLMLVKQALKHEARGYLLKTSIKEELVLAIQAAARDETYLSPSISQAVISDYLAETHHQASTNPLDLLSSRELEVLKLVIEGHTNHQIAEILSIAVKTVEKHRKSIMDTLQASDLPSLIKIAIKYGLMFLDE